MEYLELQSTGQNDKNMAPEIQEVHAHLGVLLLERLENVYS
jgi:hypothetical protein